jgi:DNA-binding response OmpR family regulator
MSSILLIEDNRDYAATLRANLEREGYEVTHAATGADGLELARGTAPDLIILDLMLPAMSGFTVLQRLRDEGSEAPVLIMTALGTEEEKLRGFGLGADDYVVKPCGLLEILARVKALLRRSSSGASPPRSDVRVADLSIDFGARIVRRGSVEITLRPKEFRFAGRTRETPRSCAVARGPSARGMGIRRGNGEPDGRDPPGGPARAVGR